MKSPITFDVYVNDALVRSETLDKDIIKIGKLPSNHLFLDTEGVSRMHAVIEVSSDGKVFIMDLGSAAGTLVDGNKVNKAQLIDGSMLTFGSCMVKVCMGENAAAAPSPTSGAPAAIDSELPTQTGDELPASEPRNPSINPFAEVRRASAMPNPLADMTDEEKLLAAEQEEYGLVASGPAVPLHEVETTERGLEVTVMWGDRSVLNVDHVSPPADYYVGEDIGEDDNGYLLGSDAIGSLRMPVCLARSNGVVVVVPPGATGDAIIDGDRKTIELMRGEGNLQQSSSLQGAEEFMLPEGAAARIKHKGFTFIVRDVKRGKKVAGVDRIDPRPLGFVGAAALLASLVLVIFYFSPPRPRGLSSDMLNTDSRLVDFLMQAEALEEEEPEWLKGAGGDAGGGKGTRAADDEGQLGDEANEKSKKKYGIEGPDPVMAREKAESEAATAGILGTLANMQGAFNSPTSPYGAEQALGNDPMNALGAMTGSEIGANFGFGGLGLRGTGRGGGGTAQGTIGMGNFGTIGRGGGKGDGEGGYGRGIGNFKGRSGGVPQVRGGKAEVRGSLSKEVIRRVVRRHINEVKFCYEQQLNARPDLEGRVTTKFVISPTGSVQSAIVANSSLRNQAVESCIVQALRRWTFPAPDGGGVVVVNYPFVLNAAGN